MTKKLSEQLQDAALAVLSIEAVSEYRQTRLSEATGLLREVAEVPEAPVISALVLRRIKEFLERARQ